MPTAKKAEPSRWTAELSNLTASLDAARRQLQTLSSDPFAALKHINSARDRLKDAGILALGAIEAVKDAIEAECLRLAVEFWGLLSDACRDAHWDLLGNTNRRLVNRALFIALEGHTVKIEGVPTACSPSVPHVIKVLAEQLQGIGSSETELRAFITTLSKAYDSASQPERGCSLETLFHHCVLETQRPTFWRHPTGSAFIALTRPMFRFRISEILRLGISTSDGRTISLGTTTTTKDAWEFYSPGEQRVVLAGRLSFDRESAHEL